MEKNCTKCKHCFEGGLNADLTKKLECRFEPPTTFPVYNGQTITIMSIFPPVNKELVCSRFEDKVKVAPFIHPA